MDTPARLQRAAAARQHPRVRHEESLVGRFAAAPDVPFARGDREVLGPDPIPYLRWVATSTQPWLPNVGEILAVDAVVERILQPVHSVTALDGIHQDLAAYYSEPIVPIQAASAAP